MAYVINAIFGYEHMTIADRLDVTTVCQQLIDSGVIDGIVSIANDYGERALKNHAYGDDTVKVVSNVDHIGIDLLYKKKLMASIGINTYGETVYVRTLRTNNMARGLEIIGLVRADFEAEDAAADKVAKRASRKLYRSNFIRPGAVNGKGQSK